MPASSVTPVCGTERKTRNLTPSPSSSTSSVEPAPRPSRRRVAAGRTICPLDETTRVAMASL